MEANPYPPSIGKDVYLYDSFVKPRNEKEIHLEFLFHFVCDFTPASRERGVGTLASPLRIPFSFCM